MTTIKNTILGLGFALFTLSSFAQNAGFNYKQNDASNGLKKSLHTILHREIQARSLAQKTNKSKESFTSTFAMIDARHSLMSSGSSKTSLAVRPSSAVSQTKSVSLTQNNIRLDFTSDAFEIAPQTMITTEPQPFLRNRRNVYSSLWAFASLNYLYADLVGLMDAHMLAQYQEGEVDGTKITPEFLTVAAAFMQVPLANVFLPQVIKNERTLRWVQIASGTLMSLVQTSTVFVGEPTPYYVLFSAIEVAATTYITIDAIKWKPLTKKKKKRKD